MVAETAIQTELELTDVHHLLSHISHLGESPQLRYHTSMFPVSFKGPMGRELLRGAPEAVLWCEPQSASV